MLPVTIRVNHFLHLFLNTVTNNDWQFIEDIIEYVANSIETWSTLLPFIDKKDSWDENSTFELSVF